MGKWIKVNKGRDLYITIFSGNVTFFEPGENHPYTSNIYFVDGQKLTVGEGYETLTEKFMSQ